MRCGVIASSIILREREHYEMHIYVLYYFRLNREGYDRCEHGR